MTSENLHQLSSRRKLLRDSVITATGAFLLPSVITSCSKEVHAPYLYMGPKGWVVISDNDLKQAAANLTRLRSFLVELYPLCSQYETAVFLALDSTEKNDGWTNFIVNIFIDLAILAASAAAIASGGAAAVPAFACLSAFLHDWGIGKGDPPSNLQSTFAEFAKGHSAMQFAIEQKLSALVDPSGDYSNLRAAWKDNIEYNGQTYTIGDLANSTFPELGEAYNKIQAAAYVSFRKSFWNLAIMKTCTLYQNYTYSMDFYKDGEYRSVTDYARKSFYADPKYKGTYLRGRITSIDIGVDRTAELVYWNLGIGGYPFPSAAIDMLFMDDTPGHIVNPDGLFNRSYVFEQFHFTKPDFSKGHELGTILEADFSSADDWNFTAGVFPNLIPK